MKKLKLGDLTIDDKYNLYEIKNLSDVKIAKAYKFKKAKNKDILNYLNKYLLLSLYDNEIETLWESYEVKRNKLFNEYGIGEFVPHFIQAS